MSLEKYLKFAGPRSSCNPISALIYLTAFRLQKSLKNLVLPKFCNFLFIRFHIASILCHMQKPVALLHNFFGQSHTYLTLSMVPLRE